MKKGYRILIILALTLGVFAAATASFAATSLISIWELSPSTTTISGQLTTNITFSVNDPVDEVHRFCIIAPTHAGDSADNWYGAMPEFIDLSASRGLTSEFLSFTKALSLTTSQAVCSMGDVSAYAAVYTATSTAFGTGVDITFNTDTGATIDLTDEGMNVATAGTGNWQLIVDEAAGTPSAQTTAVTLIDNPDTIYASDSPTCLGLGISDVSCFQSLTDAFSAASTAGSSTLVIVGDLSVPGSDFVMTLGDGGVYSHPQLDTIRGTNSGRILASDCVSASMFPAPLTIAAPSMSISDLTIDGVGCPDLGLGLAIISGTVDVDSVAINNFDAPPMFFFPGTGIYYDTFGLGIINSTVTNSSFEDNLLGAYVSGGDDIQIGTSAANGNTFTNNGFDGIFAEATVSIRGNTISGGENGISVYTDAVDIIGNHITGASSYQIFCNDPGYTGAAFNFLGGISPTSGSNCADVTSQLGAPFTGWTMGTTFGDISVSGASGDVIIFQLANDPYTYGEGMSDLAGFYAVYSENNNGDVIHSGSGGNQAKMNLDASGCSPMTNSCWVSVNDDESRAVRARAQTGSGYYALGNVDPSAVTLAGVGAANSMTLLIVVVLGSLLMLMTGVFVWRKPEA